MVPPPPSSQRPKPKLEMRNSESQPPERPVSLLSTMASRFSRPAPHTNKRKQVIRRFNFLDPPATQTATQPRRTGQSTIDGNVMALNSPAQAVSGPASSRSPSTCTMSAGQGQASSLRDPQNSYRESNQQHSQQSLSEHGDQYIHSSRQNTVTPDHSQAPSRPFSTNIYNRAIQPVFLPEPYSGPTRSPSGRHKSLIQEGSRFRTVPQQPALSTLSQRSLTSKGSHFDTTIPKLVDRPGMFTDAGRPIDSGGDGNFAAPTNGFAMPVDGPKRPTLKRDAATQADIRASKAPRSNKVDRSSERIKKVNEAVLAQKYGTVEATDGEVLDSDSAGLIKHAIMAGTEDAIQQLTADMFARMISKDTDLWAHVEKRFDAFNREDGE